MVTRRIPLPSDLELVELFGSYNSRVRYLKNKFNVDVSYSKGNVVIKGDNEKAVEAAEGVMEELIEVLLSGHLPDWSEFQYLVSHHELAIKEEKVPEKIYKNIINVTLSGLKVNAKTQGQAEYIKAINDYEIVFCIGPAGTGKTYLAVAMAVDYLRSGKVQRIILTRPAVEAGEKLGFLPGTLYEKVDPYLKPLYDALMDFLTMEKISTYKERGIIEVVPLAYMRGRTLNNSFIILDEAQNTTYQQMKMFLTRIGFNSKVVVTGDITQIDLEDKRNSGLLLVSKILKNIQGIKFVWLNEKDVVRNPIVKDIILAYEKYEKEMNKNK